MKIFVFTYDRYNTITTSEMLEKENIDHRVLVHDQEKGDKFIYCKKVVPERIIITNQPKGLPYNRNAALELMEEGEWALFLVDDFKKITGYDNYFPYGDCEELPISTTNTTEWDRRFNKEFNFYMLLEAVKESCLKAENEGINLVGFAAYKNPLFRAKKWKYGGLVDGRCIAVRKTHLRFDVNSKLMDDYCFTALNLRAFGKVLINQWILPNAARYTAGGCGTKEERMEEKIAECKYLTNTYPDYIQYAEKKDWPTGSHIVIRHKSDQNTVKLF